MDDVLGLERINQLIVAIEVRTFQLISAFILCIGLYVNHRLKNTHLYALGDKIPGPPTLPFIGNAHYFVGLDMTSFVEKLLKLRDSYGFPQRLWLGSQLWVAVANPKDIKILLRSEHAIDKVPGFLFFRVQNDGLILAAGDKWRALRKLLNPSFHMKLLEKFTLGFSRHCEVLVKVLEAEVGRDAFDIKDCLFRCTLDMVCEAQMGVKTREQIDNTSDFCSKLFRSVEILMMRIHKAYLHPEFVFNLTSYHRENKEAIKPIHRFTEEVIRQRKEILAKMSDAEGKQQFGSEKNRAIFLDTILENSPEKNLEELALYTVDLIIAGSDTSAVNIGFALLMLAMHPEYQEKAFKEQCEVLTSLESPTTMADLNKMKYMDMVVKESLRICGPPAVARLLTKDVQIENYTLPAGTNAYLSFYTLHRDKRYWKHPDKFYPDHFTPEAVEKRPKYSFTPFSMGARNCIGNQYAMFSNKTALSHLIRRYKFTTPLKMEELKYKMSLMLEPVQGLIVKIERR